MLSALSTLAVIGISIIIGILIIVSVAIGAIARWVYRAIKRQSY